MNVLLLLLVTAAPDAGALPAPRTLVGTCLGVDGPLSVVASARAAAKATELQWDVSMTTLQGRAAGITRRASASSPRAFDGVPATSELSWTELDDATQRLWSKDLLVLVSPVQGRAAGALAPLSIERLQGPCDGAAFVNGQSTPGGFSLVLIIPGESVALGSISDGAVSTIPLVQTQPRGARKKQKPGAADAPSALALDERVKLERVDARLDPVTHKSVGGAWRITLLPSKTVGQLTSTAVTFPSDGVALHQLQGGLMLKNGRGEVTGVLLEAQP